MSFWREKSRQSVSPKENRTKPFKDISLCRYSQSLLASGSAVHWALQSVSGEASPAAAAPPEPSAPHCRNGASLGTWSLGSCPAWPTGSSVTLSNPLFHSRPRFSPLWKKDIGILASHPCLLLGFQLAHCVAGFQSADHMQCGRRFFAFLAAVKHQCHRDKHGSFHSFPTVLPPDPPLQQVVLS